MSRLLILADGQLGVFNSKTATCLLRYRPDEVVAVLDREHAGRTARDVLGVPAPVPIVATVEEGLALAPDILVIGIAPQGGKLPPEWHSLITRCLEAGLSVHSGLHTFLSEDPELRELAARYGGEMVDYRKPPEGQPIAHLRARATRGRRVLTVGTDCNVGKMVAALELATAARRRGIDARFVATGQTGMMIAGSGVTLDRIPGDFMAGWVEQLTMEHGGGDLVVVEGQGCLLHPAYSSVTLALLHGCLPDAMILVHHAGREKIRNQEVPIPPLGEWIRRYEDAVAPLHPGKVAGLAINPTGLAPVEAEAAVRRAEDETGLPAVDVIAAGADRLVDAVLGQ